MTVIPFPSARLARLADSPRFSAPDLETLRSRWPSGWHETTVTDDRVAYDVWLIPRYTTVPRWR
jgi:hypothetical protein